MLRSLLVCVTFLSSWLVTSESGGNMLEHYLIRDDSDNLYIVEVEGKNGTSKGKHTVNSWNSLIVTTPTTTQHNLNTTTTQPQHCSWVGHENDCANPRHLISLP